MNLTTNINVEDTKVDWISTYKIMNNNLYLKATEPSQNDGTRSLILVPKLKADHFFIEDTQFGKTINKFNTRLVLSVRFINSRYYLYLSKNINKTSYWELINGEFKNKLYNKMCAIPTIFVSLSETKNQDWSFVQD